MRLQDKREKEFRKKSNSDVTIKFEEVGRSQNCIWRNIRIYTAVRLIVR
ncbi:hypothetical protein pb186bvf_008209 [Paramecium bursaria]